MGIVRPPWIEDLGHPSVARVWERLAGARRDREEEYVTYVAVAGPLLQFLHSSSGVDWQRVFARGWWWFTYAVVADLMEPDEEVYEGELVPEGAPLITEPVIRKYSGQPLVPILLDIALLSRRRFRLARCQWGARPHYFFATGTRGRLPQACPLHEPLWNQERVR